MRWSILEDLLSFLLQLLHGAVTERQRCSSYPLRLHVHHRQVIVLRNRRRSAIELATSLLHKYFDPLLQCLNHELVLLVPGTLLLNL